MALNQKKAKLSGKSEPIDVDAKVSKMVEVQAEAAPAQLESPPPSSSITCFASTIEHTPRTLRRTPNSLLKAPTAVNHQSLSPLSNACNMDMDLDSRTDASSLNMPNAPLTVINRNIAKMPPATISHVNKISLHQQRHLNTATRGGAIQPHHISSLSYSAAHSRRLFDHNGNMSNVNNMNKKLQFDDSDNEEPCASSSSSSSMSNSSRPNDESNGSCVSPVHQFMPLKMSSLSNSSSSLFKPITRFINQHYNMSTNQSYSYHGSGMCSGGGGGLNPVSSSSCSNMSLVGTTAIRSPNSPFQFNQLHANINPFTPTNPFANKIVPNNNLLMHNESHRQQSAKRCNSHQTCMETANDNDMDEHDLYEQANSNEFHNNSSNSNDLCINNNNTAESSSSSSSSNITTNNITNTLPKNKRLALRQCLVSRYHEEFHEVCKLGSGEFGDVFKCINRLDGCTYAIKRSKKPIAGSALEIAAWKEVCAHAVLVKHNHIVQYYSAWAEADRMLIQNEYCNGGSLAEFIEQLKSANNADKSALSSSMFSEYDLKLLLLHIAKGLAYMHSLNLVHLDIKPGNIFICRTPRRHHHQQQQHATTQQSVESSTQSLNNQNGVIINEESGIESEELDDDDDDDICALTMSNKAADTRAGVTSDAAVTATAALQLTNTNAANNYSIFSDIITYKIGDLGHVTSTLDPHVEEGDCRYLPNEILQEQYDALAKADVFALALTVFVCGSQEELPKNGEQWHWIRQGNLKDLPQCNEKFKKLLTQMVSENPANRPSASTLVHHPCIVPDASKSKSQLRKELNQEKFKNEMLKRKVRKYEQQLSNTDTTTATMVSANLNRNNLTVGNSSSFGAKFSRSLSSTLL